MNPKIKSRTARLHSAESPVPVKPLLLHDVTNPASPAQSAARRRLRSTGPASGAANHARHHVARNAQA